MGDMGDLWKDAKPELKRMSRERRARNRQAGQSELFLKRIPFLKKNNGAHLIVNPDDPHSRADYWPGTGLWKSYFGEHHGRGIKSLMSWIERARKE